MEEKKIEEKIVEQKNQTTETTEAPQSTVATSASNKSLPDQEDVIGSGSWGSLWGIFYLIAMRAWVWVLITIVVAIVSVAVPPLAILSTLLMIYLIIKAKSIAWKTRKWRDFQHFLAVQRAWDLAGKIILVVQILAVIGILATVVLLNVGSERNKARDTMRKSNVTSIINAVELYRVDNTICPASLSVLSPKYLDPIPKDPSTKSDYAYKIDGENCIISADLEVDSDSLLKNDYDPSNGAIFDLSAPPIGDKASE